MTESLKFSTPEWKGEFRVVEVKGGHAVKGAILIRPTLLTPFFAVRTFKGEGSHQRATTYATRLVEAIETLEEGDEQ